MNLPMFNKLHPDIVEACRLVDSKCEEEEEKFKKGCTIPAKLRKENLKLIEKQRLKKKEMNRRNRHSPGQKLKRQVKNFLRRSQQQQQQQQETSVSDDKDIRAKKIREEFDKHTEIILQHISRCLSSNSETHQQL